MATTFAFAEEGLLVSETMCVMRKFLWGAISLFLFTLAHYRNRYGLML